MIEGIAVYVVKKAETWQHAWEIHSVHKTRKGAEQERNKLLEEDSQWDCEIQTIEVRK